MTLKKETKEKRLIKARLIEALDIYRIKITKEQIYNICYSFIN